jgi:demethylmenaquinone methyltransferase/2-methoxy-6-polyprenyl-1,4-benzoquinol methylase
MSATPTPDDHPESPLSTDRLVAGQLDYYRARAPEYDEWFLRLGRYDRGEEHRRRWTEELGAVRGALRQAHPGGDILELACGTGLWTPEIAAHCRSLTAVDGSREVIALNQSRLRDPRIRYVQADLFQWQPDRQYDAVFFGFWLSHVPLSRLESFWCLVERAVKPGGIIFFVDGLPTDSSTALDHGPLSRSHREIRRLKDGREFQIVKIFHEPDALAEVLKGRGWCGEVRRTREFFYYGCFKT